MGAIVGPVLVAYHSGPMRRILRLNLEVEQITVIEAGTTAQCLAALGQHRVAALVLDPELFTRPGEEASVCARVRQLGLPVLVVADGREHRRLARLLDDAPFCSRPDNLESVTAAVRGLIAGASLPALI